MGIGESLIRSFYFKEKSLALTLFFMVKKSDIIIEMNTLCSFLLFCILKVYGKWGWRYV